MRYKNHTWRDHSNVVLYEIGWFMFLISRLVIVMAYQLFSPEFGDNSITRDSTRYFNNEILLPPLICCANIAHGTTTPHASNMLHVQYTNHPMVVTRWFADNIPQTGCTVGFDVEVSHSLGGEVHPCDFPVLIVSGSR
jgi:hypothetical protein